jgi:hypothetical protein
MPWRVHGAGDSAPTISAARHRAMRPRQGFELSHKIRDDIDADHPPTLAGLGDGALQRVGLDTVCRCFELAASGSGRPVSKMMKPLRSDLAGDGRVVCTAHPRHDGRRIWTEVRE